VWSIEQLPAQMVAVMLGEGFKEEYPPSGAAISLNPENM
jgi:hypothetical protein